MGSPSSSSAAELSTVTTLLLAVGLYVALFLLVRIWGRKVWGYEAPLRAYGLSLFHSPSLESGLGEDGEGELLGAGALDGPMSASRGDTEGHCEGMREHRRGVWRWLDREQVSLVGWGLLSGAFLVFLCYSIHFAAALLFFPISHQPFPHLPSGNDFLLFLPQSPTSAAAAAAAAQSSSISSLSPSACLTVIQILLTSSFSSLAKLIASAPTVASTAAVSAPAFAAAVCAAAFAAGGLFRRVVESVAVGLAVSVVEELVFRGWLEREMASDVGVHAAALLSALVFAAVHWRIPTMPGLIVLGLILSALRRRCSGSLSVAIGLHAGLISANQIAALCGFGPCCHAPAWLTGSHVANPLAGAVGLTILCLVCAAVYPWRSLFVPAYVSDSDEEWNEDEE